MTFWNSLNVFYFFNACQINSSSVSKPYYINLSMLNKGLYHGSRASSSLLFFAPLLHPIFLIFFRFLDPPPHSLTANLLLENARQKRRLECYLPEVFSPQGVLSGSALKQVTPEKKLCSIAGRTSSPKRLVLCTSLVSSHVLCWHNTGHEDEGVKWPAAEINASHSQDFHSRTGNTVNMTKGTNVQAGKKKKIQRVGEREKKAQQEVRGMMGK